jgi:pimeloyl-ACP methyl ester carboxylesterase
MITNTSERREERPARILTLALASLALAACGEPSAVPAANPSPEGLAALAEAAPGGTDAVGWRAIAGLGVPAWLFYPAAQSAGAPAPAAGEPRLPGDYAQGLVRRFGPVAAATLLAAPGHAIADAPMAKGAHPLVIFAPGAAMGGRDYRLFAEALAARGLAVAVLRPTGSPGASDDRYGEAAGEIAAALAALRGKSGIDAARPVLVGHSLGGAAAVLAAARTGACAANIDGDFGGATAQAVPGAPVLYVIGDPDLDRPRDVARRAEVWRAVSARAGDQALALGIAGMRHFDMADAAHLPTGIVPEERREDRFGSIGGPRARAVLVDLVSGLAQACRQTARTPLAQALPLPGEARAIFLP